MPQANLILFLWYLLCSSLWFILQTAPFPGANIVIPMQFCNNGMGIGPIHTSIATRSHHTTSYRSQIAVQHSVKVARERPVRWGRGRFQKCGQEMEDGYEGNIVLWMRNAPHRFCRDVSSTCWWKQQHRIHHTFRPRALGHQSKGGFILSTPSSALTRFHTLLKCV